MILSRSPSSSAGRRSHLDDLLKSPLDTAFALTEMRRRRRSGRRGSAPRHGERGGCTPRHRHRRSRTQPRPRSGTADRRHRSRLADSTARVPRPPPPASALMIIAPPRSDAKNACASSSVTARSIPRITGTSAATAAVRARALSPNNSRCSASARRRSAPPSRNSRAKSPLSAGSRSQDGLHRSRWPWPPRSRHRRPDTPPRPGPAVLALRRRRAHAGCARRRRE